MKKVSTPAMVIYVILALVVGSYLYYSQYFIPQKEDVLIRKAVRTLSNIEDGITEKEQFLKDFMDQRLAANFLNEVLDSINASDAGKFDRIKGDDIKKVLNNHIQPLAIEHVDWDEPYPQVEFKVGRKGELPYLQIKQIKSYSSPEVFETAKSGADSLSDGSSEEKPNDLINTYLDDNFFSKEFVSWSVLAKELNDLTQQTVEAPVIVDSERTKSPADSTLAARVGIDTLLTGITNNEIFECVVVHSIDSGRIYYSDNLSLIDPLFKFDLGKKDSLTTRFGVNILEVQVNSLPYVEFRRFAQLGDKTVYLSGFISKDDYNEYLKEIDYFLLILVLLGTFTLIGAVPLIKVFVINEWERLRDGDVVFSGLSLLFVVFFGSLIATTVSHYDLVEEKLDLDLEKYSEELSTNFIEEVDSILDRASEFEFSNYHWSDSRNFLFHEFFLTDTGSIKSIVLPYNDQGINWKGDDVLKRFFEKFVNLQKRDYVQKIQNDEGYRFYHQEADTLFVRQFYLESVFSYSRGQTEAVVSFPYRPYVVCVYDSLLADDPSTSIQYRKAASSDLRDSKYEVGGMSVDLKSLMWSVPPEGFGYALIDRDLNVMFSSKKAKNNFKNLRTDLVGNEFMESAITYNVPMEGHFDFGRDKFSGYIAPIDGVFSGAVNLTATEGKPSLFLLTFANHDLVEWHTGLSSLLAAMSCFGILIASIFLLIIQRIFKITRRDYRFFKKTNFYETVFPERQDGITYLLLSIISVAGIVVGFAIFEYGLRALVRYGVVQVFLMGMLRPLLLSYSTSLKSKKLKRAYFLVVSAILVFVIFAFPGSTILDESSISPDQTILFFYALAFVLIAVFLKRELLKSKNDPWSFKEKWYFSTLRYFLRSGNAKSTFVFSTFSWILAILVVPFLLISYKCQDITKNSFAVMAGNRLEQKVAKEESQLKDTYRAYDAIHHKVSHLHLDSAWQKFVSDSIYFNSEVGATTPTNRTQLFDPVFRLFANRYNYDPLYIAAEGDIGYLNSIGITGTHKVENKTYDTSEILLFFLTVIGLYALVRMFLNRILFNVSPELQGGRVRSFNVIRGLKKYYTYRQVEGDPLRMFLVGIPRSRRTTILNSIGFERADMGFIDFGRNTSFLDLPYDRENIPEEILQSKIVIIRFWFPEEIGNEYLDRLKKLTRYMEESTLYYKDSIILSDLTITQIEDSWHILNKGAVKTSASAEIMLYLKEWFRSYREFILPIERERFKDSRAISGQIGDREAYDDYLNKSYYAPIYFSVWHSLSMKERFILFDLAEDGLLNARDNYVLMKLRRKGILNYSRDTYRMELFHRSFKLFVRHGVSTEEILEIERISKRNGSWGQIRLALLLLILAMLLFINTLMPNMFNALVGAIGVIASFSGAVSQISGSFKMPQFGKLFSGNKGASGG